MRVTGGRWRSRRLRGPSAGMRLRPTPDALRERSFAVLANRVDGCRFLDLYAGTGAVALEALSRGAEAAVLVEVHRGAGRIIRANLDAFDLHKPVVHLLLRSADRAVRELARRNAVFDLVWADPPFPVWEEGMEAVQLAFELGVITPAGCACLECPEHADTSLIPASLQLERDLDGGASRLWLLRLREGG